MLIENPKLQTRIMLFGTFDILHPGHLSLFVQAKKLFKNSYLIVSVARGVNVKKIKGKKPLNSERVRLKNIKNLNLVDRVVLGAKEDYLSHILKESPSVIALGYDQKEYTEGLAKKLVEKGLKVKIIRLKSYFPKKYKSSIFKRKMI
ncbi:MAG: adenylyltransferase/cytidyltransferase family protein [Candidatus Doudnabacteria bacterium]|nr:adenylyltransferase/cytidyltransferase family protein [Candidatus Doudnabacteria bacterium]